MIDNRTVVAPTIHMNGTSGTELLDALDTAMIALHDAQEALQKTSPNARDYYVVAADTFTFARDQHRSRLERLIEIHAELAEIASSVSDQILARRK